MTIEMVDVIVGLFFTIVGGTIGILGYKRTERKDDDEKVRHDTKIDVKLDNIAKNVDEIRLDNKDFSKTVNKLNERVSAVETRVETVSERVDGLEKLHLNK